LQLIQRLENIEIRRVKELKRKEYSPKTEIIAID